MRVSVGGFPRRTLAAAGLAAAAALIVGLPPVANAAGEVNIYNSRHYNTDRALYEGFTAKTGIKVNMIEGNHDELRQRLKSEGAGSPADLLITVDAGRLAIAANEGLLQPVKSAVIDAAIPASLREPSGLWIGLSTRARVLVYAKDRVKPADLSTYEALADEKWKGKLLIRSGTNIYNLGLVGSIIAANGPEKAEAWAKAVVGNLARPPQGGDTDQIKAVAAGEGDVAISNTYYLATLANSPKPEDKAVAEKVAVFFPNQGDRGTHVNISGAGLTKHAPNRDNAIKLLEYLVSPEAQKYFAEGNFEYPANPAVALHPTLAGWGKFKADALNPAEFVKYSQDVVKLMDRVGWK